jgi:predicted metal-dependent phosphoesterase TrpH
MVDLQVDLHTHSIYSDGNLSPTELLQKASDIGLSVIALTDHDTTSGLTEFLESAKNFPNIRAIAGCEFSCESPFELHILALNIKNIERMSSYTKLDEMSFKYAKAAVDYLNNIGIKTTFEELIKDNVGSFTSADIVKYAIKKKIVKTNWEGYDNFIIGNEFLDKYEIRKPIDEVLKIILDANAIPVLAHPKRTKLKYNELKALLKKLVDMGLQGLECYYSKHDDNDIETYLSLAKEFGLVVSGGSDFHGDGRVEIGAGSTNGRKILKEYVEEIL